MQGSEMLREFEGKQLFATHGIPTLDYLLVENPGDPLPACMADSLVLKVQVKSGKRARRGLIRFIKDPETELHHGILALAEKMEDMGLEATPILIEPMVTIEKEIYASVLLDRSHKRILLMVSGTGGVNIEETARHEVGSIVKRWFPVSVKSHDISLGDMLVGWDLEGYPVDILVGILTRMIMMVREEDMLLAEINPLAFTIEHGWLALDAKVILDMNARFRHPDWDSLPSLDEWGNEMEALASRAGIALVMLDGDIGLISSGAGLAMATCDMVHSFGGAPANFLDIGGGASSGRVKKALDILLQDDDIHALLVNVFGGITRCDDVALGILKALDEKSVDIPLVVRLAGTNQDLGIRLLRARGIVACTNMEEAVRAVVVAAGEHKTGEHS
ncbi:succinate--CoA ligase subunit beta [Candidatus Bathyarchaeota archaeon]|nr:succinate--CoA ligase subunit beta [Candidatus Bathyarchaeota archaeon]